MEKKQAGLLATECKQLPLGVGYPPAGPESTGMTACRTPPHSMYWMIAHERKIRASPRVSLAGFVVSRFDHLSASLVKSESCNQLESSSEVDQQTWPIIFRR